MKKTALTFGLFSLVMVATSFAAPENPTYLADSDTIIDGGATGRTKKLDFHGTNDQTLNNSQSNFSSVNQAFGSDKKID
ncbi:MULTISPECIES: hypothetical protein [Flavobacterium]|uniref:Uncharacterized protein n=1 Tax=Flavobacterium resistens TaxID=443612 RepID=A0A521E6D9_9FLAO|nr:MULTISPECIES: hypothetical protein [Flavobacterium]MRX69150.1 hypothetical protein [Flavobacterium resistens]SMO79467.1 hypothetical protein SAMN06265349_104165 [Flavobacterium resistens]